MYFELLKGVPVKKKTPCICTGLSFGVFEESRDLLSDSNSQILPITIHTGCHVVWTNQPSILLSRLLISSRQLIVTFDSFQCDQKWSCLADILTLAAANSWSQSCIDWSAIKSYFGAQNNLGCPVQPSADPVQMQQNWFREAFQCQNFLWDQQ